MSIGAFPTVDYSKFDKQISALTAKSSAFNLNDSIFSIQGFPDILGPNSIFDIGNDLTLPGTPDLSGLGGSGDNGFPFDLGSFTSLSNGNEEKFVADSSASAIDMILDMKIPPIPNAK
jgi:hypothetical protein